MKKTKKAKHLTKFCKHPGNYGAAEGWCKYCRLKTFGGVSAKELKLIVDTDRKGSS